MEINYITAFNLGGTKIEDQDPIYMQKSTD